MASVPYFKGLAASLKLKQNMKKHPNRLGKYLRNYCNLKKEEKHTNTLTNTLELIPIFSKLIRITLKTKL